MPRMLRREPMQALVFFSFGDPLNEAGEVSIVNAGEATDVTVTNIEAAEKLIRAEPSVITREPQERLCKGTAVTMFILYDHLYVRKQCPRWIPALTDEQRRERVERCEYMSRNSTDAVHD